MKENENLKARAISAMFYSFGGFVVGSGIQFVITVILARLLLPEDYGLLGMIVIFTSISQMFIDSGMTAALIREKNPSEEDFSTVFYYNLGLAILLYFVLFISANVISGFFDEPQLVGIIRVVGINLIIGSFGLIQRTILVRKLDFKSQTKIEVLAGLIAGIIAILMAFLGFGVWSLVVQLLSKQLIISTLFILNNKWKPLLVFNFSSFKRLFGFGWKMLVTGLLATLYNNVYNIIIGRVYSSSQLGYYTKSIQLRDLAAHSITTSVEKVSYPLLSQLQNERNSFKNGFMKIIKLSSFLTFPLMIGLTVAANPLIYVIFGEKWIPMVPYFQILCLAGLTFPHRAINLNILKVVGRSDLFLRLDILKIVVGLLSIGFVIVMNLGIYGLLWSSFFHAQFAFFVNSMFSKRYISYSTKNQLVDMTPSLIASILMGIAMYLTNKLLPFNAYTNLLLQIPIGFAVYVYVCKMFRIKELETMIQLIRSLKRSINNKRRNSL
ncbi:lipopolysaccharide biosynthesis protein [Mesotoga sp.]|uniref:lipopolysaccharide biosynthesis protein n=1 Tax=Mesotoga sp. TaxID=2053577 RepID=UPI001BD327D5|nr:lipopolysaccharide biosynthesis protein [Mesotoga sp.]